MTLKKETFRLILFVHKIVLFGVTHVWLSICILQYVIKEYVYDTVKCQGDELGDNISILFLFFSESSVPGTLT